MIAPEDDWLGARALATPDAPALECGGRVVSYAELDRRAKRLASRLSDLGIARGDVVAALLENGLELPLLLWALRAIGAVLLPLSWRLTPEELAHPLGESAASLLVHAGGSLAPKAADAASVGCATAVLDAAGTITLDAGLRPARRSPDGLTEGAMALLYTSGTSGPPKGAVLGAEAFLASARASESLIGAGPDDRWLVCMPLFHVGGLSILVRSCLAGGVSIVHAGFDPEAVDRDLDRAGVTVVSLVASMLDRLLAVRGDRPAPASLRCALLGGGPTPAPLIERARELGWPVAPTYGLTEAASQVATRLPGDEALPASGGLRPLPGTTVDIVDAAGRDVPPGIAGEIVVSGGTLMRGYLRQPGATSHALRGGRLHTGDIGMLDGAGRLAVLDRRDDLIVSGGENVYPAEVEAVLLRHPSVAEAAVVGIADPRYGARPVAYWAPTDGAASEPDLAEHCRASLAGFKVPVAFHRRDALPRSASGKLLRRRLRGPSADA